jgi:hypothetical protein
MKKDSNFIKKALRDRVGYFTDSRPGFGVFWQATVRRLMIQRVVLFWQRFHREALTQTRKAQQQTVIHTKFKE